MRRKLISSVRTIGALAIAIGVATSAASATTWNVPGNGSNVCTTGNPNCNTIAQAVTASTSGDTVLLGAGNHAVASAITLTKTLTFTGAGIGVTNVQPTTTAFSVRTNNIVFQDFTFQNGAIGIAFQNASSNNTQVTRVQFSGQTSRGMDISLPSSFTVSNVSIADSQFATPNIAIRTSSQAQVAGLTISNTTFTGGIYGLYVANDANVSRFSGLTIQNNCVFSGITRAIYAEELKDAVIEDSSFSGPGTWAIQLVKFYATNGVPVSNVTIRRNTFSNFASSAIDAEIYGLALGSPGLTIEDNSIQQNVGLYAANNAALFVTLASSLTHGPVAILNNDLTLSGTLGAATAAHGIQLRGNGPVTLTGNVIDGGGVGGSGTTPASSGLFVESRSGSQVMPATTSIVASCNRIGGFHNGVSVFDSVGGVYGGLPAGATVTLDDNDITGNATAGVANGALSPTVDAQDNWWGCAAGPGNPGCDNVIGAVDASSPASAPSPCAPCTSSAQCDDDNPCTVDACAGTCANTPGNAGATCRPAAGDCDLTDTCDGTNAACPADAKSTAVCRASGGACDLAESCDGIADTCPTDAKSTAVCRASAGACDLAESCDGIADTCPTDAKSTAVCRASAGACDLAESCDGIADTCPADAKSAAVCRASAGACDLAESCDGIADSCPADAAAADGTSCSDGQYCNGAEECQGGVCQGGSAPCVQLCNESADLCESGCLPAPQACRTAVRSTLLAKLSGVAKDKLIWKWVKGASTSQTEFGDPTTTADYTLCVYAGPTDVLVGEMLIPAGASHWSQLGTKGYKFNDINGTPDGITRVFLKGSAQNKSRAMVKGSRTALPDLPLPLADPVTVQLVNSTSGLCFGAEYSGAQLRKNQTGLLKAKAQ